MTQEEAQEEINDLNKHAEDILKSPETARNFLVRAGILNQQEINAPSDNSSKDS